MTDFLKVYFMKNQFYLVISLWGVTFGIRAYDFKMICGPWGSELIAIVRLV